MYPTTWNPSSTFSITSFSASSRHSRHTLQHTCMQLFEEDRLVNDYRLGVQVHVSGRCKMHNMECGTPPVNPTFNLTIKVVLKDLAALCAKHFALFDTRAMDQCYIPLATPPRSSLQASTTRSVIEVERYLMQQMEGAISRCPLGA